MPAPFTTTNPSEFLRLEGLYIFEQNPPGFVRGVSLGVVGIFGPTTKGPVDEPVLITSEARFLEVFGGRDYGGGGALINKTWRALLNKPFGRLWISRAAAGDAVLASFTEEDTDGGGGVAIVRLDATSVGFWGNSAKFRIESATDADANHWNLKVRLNGTDVTYENIDTTTGNDNLAEVLGDDLANNMVVTKLADGRPLNTDSNTGAYLAALDANGFMNLGTTVTGYVSVVGSDGTIVAADYTGAGRAIDSIKEFKGISILMSSEDAEALVTVINTSLVVAAAASSDRMFCIWSGDHAENVTAVVAYQATINRNDRIIHCYNSPFTVDTEVGTQIQTPPVEWMASILSQTDVDIHPGEEATKKFTSGISKITNASLTREDYILLKEAGIAALERDEGFTFVSGVVTDLTPGKTQITRRRSADFLQLSASGRLKFFVKKKNLATTRRIMGGEIGSFSKALQNDQRVVQGFEVDQESVNTQTQRDQGLEFILWRVKLIGHILHLVLKTEIGTGVTIEL